MSGRWAWIHAFVLALLCGLVLYSRVHVQFEPIRWKVITTTIPSDGGRVSFVVPSSPRLARSQGPVVLIARIRNSSNSEIRLNATVDHYRLATMTVPPRSARRVDMAGPPELIVRAGSTIALQGARGDEWSLEYLEIANVHGSSRSFLRFVIVPESLRDYPRPPLWFVALVYVGILGVALIDQSTPRRRGWAGISRAVQLVVLVFFVAALASAIITPFQILMAPRTFAICVALAFGHGLLRVIADTRAYIISKTGSRSSAIDAAAAAVAVGLFYGAATFVNLAWYGGNYSGMLQLSEERIRQVSFLNHRQDLLRSLVLQDSGGYDGQFAYLMTFDPFLEIYKDDPSRYGTIVDAAPYRYGRIGFSLLTKLASADQPERYPVTMVWLIVAGHVVAALFLALIFVHYGRQPAWSLLYLLVPGFLQSLHVALPESIAAACLLGGYWCWLKSKLWGVALFLGFSLLIRETGAILLAALVLGEWVQRRQIRPVATLAAGFAPLIVWRAYVCWRLFPAWGWEGFFFDPRNMGLPFAGLLDLWSRIADGTYAPDAPELVLAGTFYPLILLAAFVLSVAYLWRRPTGLSIAIFAYAAVAVSLNYSAIWLHVGNGERGTYEVLLLLAVAWASLEQESRLRAPLLGFFGALALYLLFASLDTQVVRQVIGI